MKLKILSAAFICMSAVIICISLNTKNVVAENEFSIIQELLPHGVEIICKNNDINTPLIVKKDIDNDSEEETFVMYRDKNINNVLFLAVLKRREDKFKIYSTLKGEGDELDFLDFLDISGDGSDDIIFGLKLGSGYGKINAFSVNGNSLERIFSTTYSKIEIILKDEYGNKSKQAALAIWVKDIKARDAYKVNIVRWNGREFIPAREIYKQYYKTIIEFYEKKLSDMPNEASYWYYLADAQIKSGIKQDALRSISKGVSLDAPYPSKQQFEELKRSIK